MKLKLFYGWYIVAACLILMAYFSSMFVYGWTAFVGPIVSTFGWSMAAISLGSSLRSLESGVFNPLWGPIIDRCSPRKLALIGTVCSALGILCLSQTRNLAMYYGGWVIIGLGSSLVTGIFPPTIISRWFRKNIGMANGLLYMGVGLGGVLVPVVVKLIDRYSWQTTLLFGAIGVLVLGMILFFIIRSRPQDYGLLPDGKALDAASGSSSTQLYDFSTGVVQLLKSRAFWQIGVATIWQFSAFSTVSIFAMPYLTGLGISRPTASMVVSLYTLASVFGRLFIGMFSDYFRKTYVWALSIALMGAGLFIFWSINATSPLWLVLLFGVIYGLGLSGISPLRAPIAAEYFGVRSFGTIFGVISVFSAVAQVVSQPLAGWIFDTYHDYKPWWLVLVVYGILALIVTLAMPAANKGR